MTAGGVTHSALRRLALVALGVVLAVAVLELALHVGAFALWATGRPAPVAWLGGRLRVLCVGDSNTYGLYLADRADAYPQQLERLWNAAPERAPIEVLNLGYPGTNSSKLVRDLPRMLETLRPDMVLIMVGSNDYWTAPVPPAERDGGGAARLIERYSRVYQLVHMLRRAFDQRRLEVEYPVRVAGGSSGTARFGDVEFPLGWEPAARPGGKETYVALETNLRRLADIVRSYRAEPIFLTFGSAMWNYGDANRALRNAAAASGVRLVDSAAALAAVCPREPCQEWFYRDHHPTAAGYRLIAEAAVHRLAD